MRKLAHWLRILRMMPVERHPQMESTQTRSTLLELALLYLRLGMTAFGGPAVHISMMEEERWLPAAAG
jgi:chromate transporter